MTSLAALGGVLGTPAFMAPEVVAAPDQVDQRADIYALGCVAYYLLTGEHVFHGRTPLQALVDHVGTPPGRPSARAASEVPGWLDDLVLACLAKDPADRPATVAVILQRIVMLEAGPKWTQAQARDWWQRHLPELAGAETVAAAATVAR